jgi:toxin-antitoxin system PIN domain toxin
VILVDANILIYAYSRTSPHHESAAQWLQNVMDRREEIGLPWQTLLAFVRLTTSAVFTNTGTLETALQHLDELLAESNVAVISPGPVHWQLLQRMLRAGQARKNLVNDAHLAALAIEHNAALCTNDRDFTRFPGLKIVNPVAKQ